MGRFGQYYRIIFLAEKQDGSTDTSETIRTWFVPSYVKLMEHSYLDEHFLRFIEFLLSKNGMFYRSRIVWAGDYADPELELGLDKDENKGDAKEKSTRNLYQMCSLDQMVDEMVYLQGSLIEALCGHMDSQLIDQRAWSYTMQSKIGDTYIVNHTKKQFVQIRKGGQPQDGIHPLPLLVSEGNGRGRGERNGDYFGSNQELCGTWARDVISIEEKEHIPGDYTELVCEFVSDFDRDFF
jgi:hypothetical protein